MDNNHLTTLIGLLAQDRVDRAGAELQAALNFQERVNMILSGMGGITTDDSAVVAKGKTGGITQEEAPVAVAPAPVQNEKANPRPTGRKRKAGSMIENMIRVMGTSVMTAGDVAEALEAAGLAPESNNLKGYISSVFSSTKDENGEKLFRTVSRGKYTVAQAVQQNEPEIEGEAASDTSASPADQILAEQGLSVSSFQQAPAFS